VKLKATIIVASLLAATAAHADTIYLKCWAQGLAGDQLNVGLAANLVSTRPVGRRAKPRDIGRLNNEIMANWIRYQSVLADPSE
jgi:hypothetical protein